MLFVLATCGVGEDLVGWQCRGLGGRCADASPHWLFRHVLVSGQATPGQALLLGALVPVLTIVALGVVSARTSDRYERTAADLRGYRPDLDVEHAPDTNALEVGLASPVMWRNEWPVRRLRALHLQCAAAVVLATLAAPADARWLAALPAAVLGYAVIVLALPTYTGHGRSARWLAASVAVWLVLAAVAVAEGVGLGLDDGWLAARYLRTGRPTGGLPFFAASVLTEFVVALAVLVLLVVAVGLALLSRDRSAPPPGHAPLRAGPGAAACAVFAAFGVFLAAAFSAGVYTYAATWLHTGSVKPGFGAVSRIDQVFVVPGAVRAAGQAYALAAGVLLVGLLAGLVWFLVAFGALPGRRRVRALVPRGALERDYGAAAVRSDPGRARTIARAVFLGRVLDLVPWLLAPLVAAGVVIVAVFGVHEAVSAGGDARRPSTSPDGFLAADSLRGTGAYLAVLTLLALVVLGSLAFRTPATRRSVGILWDVASFWPRACHPLAPPSYAERTVPDLVTRISAYRVADPHAVLVLAAHSQGTVISAAALAQLGTYDTQAGKLVRTSVLPGVGWLTFGCVLRRLYARYFPVYFAPARLAELQGLLSADSDTATLPRWRNLWRYTDYLGGQVTAGPPPVVPAQDCPAIDPDVLLDAPPVTGPAPWEWHSPDPPLFARADGDTTFPPPGRHSSFWADASGYFQLAAVELVSQIRAEGPDRADPPPTPATPT